jgi:hypothetical protein
MICEMMRLIFRTALCGPPVTGEKETDPRHAIQRVECVVA